MKNEKLVKNPKTKGQKKWIRNRRRVKNNILRNVAL